jgi:DNA invertase Pin-like site-specific DNA recombinase
MTAADLYLRLSDARLEGALDGREAKLRADARRRGWTVAEVVIENDVDPEGKLLPATAFKRKKVRTPGGKVKMRVIRPRFRKILDRLEAGVTQAMLAEDLDRALRDPRDMEDLIDACELKGASAASITGTLKLTNGGTPDEQFMARILVNAAYKASADTARRVAASRERLAGKSYQGGRRPYGYEPEPGTEKYQRNLVQKPGEAAVIRQAATDILDLGISLKAIARDLRERNVPTVTGTAWSAETLKDVLLKPATAGLAVAGKDDDGKPVLVDAPWPAILERDRWERLADKLNDPARRTNLARANEPRWLVSGFAACGVCGGRTRVIGGKGGMPAYTGAACAHFRRKAADLDLYIAETVIEILSRPEAAGLLRPAPRPGVDARRLRTEARKLRARKAAQMRLHAAGDIDDADLAEGMRAIRDRLAQIDVRLAASDQADPLPEFREGRPAEAVWAGLSMARKRAVVQTLIQSVVINRTANRGRRYAIEDTVEVTPAAGVLSHS